MGPNDFLAWRWLKSILDARGLDAPDGRALYQYNLTTAEIAGLKGTLSQAFHIALPDSPRLLGAAFCLWTAHWFQREFNGGQWAWAGAMDPIGAPNDPVSRETLVTDGMAYLKRPIRRLNGTREFLAGLVLEGGFPSRLISQDGGWLTRYVEAVTLAASHGPNTPETALEHATFYHSIIPPLFRAASLYHLAADLAHHVAELRRRLADNGITEGAIEWLDRVDPQWRDGLPISTSDEAARRLVEGLVRVKARAPVMPVACRRLLKRDASGNWSFALRMQIEGRIDDDDLPTEVRTWLTSVNRARILPSGLLERKGLPAIGVANRTEDADWHGWEVESLLGSRPTVVNDFPIDTDAHLVFTLTGRPGVEFVPSGGARIVSEILVFRAESVDDAGDASTLLLTGTGSVKDREAFIYAAVPEESDIILENGAEFIEIARVAGRKLIRISGVVAINVAGDRYRLQSNAEHSESARIEAVGQPLRGVSSTYSIFRGCPGFIIHRGILKRRGDQKSLKMRVPGQKAPWDPFDADRLPVGLVEIGAVEKDVVLDRLTIVHLPENAEMRASIPTKGTCRIELSHIGTENFQPIGAAPGTELTANGGGVVCIISGLTTGPRALTLRARWLKSEALLSVPVLAEKLAFYDAAGKVIPNNADVSMATLRGAGVEAVDRSSVLLTLREQAGEDRMLCVERSFDHTLPFSQIREDIERLFAMTDDLDARIKIEAVHSGHTASIIFVRRFDITLEPDLDQEVTLASASMQRLIAERSKEVWVYGRPFSDLAGEDRRLDTFADETGLHWTVPEGEGPWFVYAKVDGVTRSRPLHVNRELWDTEPIGPLLKAVTTVHRYERERLVTCVLQEIGAGDVGGARDELAAFIGSLDPAIPLQSFDILRLLPSTPAAAVWLAVHGGESILQRILEIDEKLPLSWFTTSPASWTSAFNQAHGRYLNKMREANIPDADRYADELVRKRMQELARRRPCLSLHMALSLRALRLSCDNGATQRLREAYAVVENGAIFASRLAPLLRQEISECRKRNDGRQWPSPVGFRDRIPHLATLGFETPNWTYAILDAPCAAAAIALGDAQWAPDLERMIRISNAFDPSYFEQALLYSLTIGLSRPGRKAAGAA